MTREQEVERTSLTGAIVEECVSFFEGAHPPRAIDDEILMAALLSALAFGLVEVHRTDEEATAALLKMLPEALKREREISRSMGDRFSPAH